MDNYISMNIDKSLCSLDGEIWKDIAGQQYYQVSNKGRIKSLQREIITRKGVFQVFKEKMIKPSIDVRGHLMFGCTSKNKRTILRVHREVAKAFVPNPLNLPDVKNIDGDALNNTPENLKWFDSREKIIGLQKQALKEQRIQAKRDYRKRMISKINEHAKERGGKCLSAEYISMNHKLTFQCKIGHIWQAIPNTVYKRGSWCKLCSSSNGEELCRYVLGKMLHTEFVKIRPDWLRNKDGYVLELDGYSQELNIAFEYQGIQHYSLNKFWNSNNSNKKFLKQLEHDRMKVEKCKQNGVKLLIIPFFIEFTTKKIVASISAELEKHEINVNHISDLNINDFFSNKELHKNHKRVSDVVQCRGGVILDKVTALNQLVNFKCENGHVFKTRASRILNGGWCRFCGYKNGSMKRLKSIEEAHEIAHKYEGICLSKKYLGSKKRHDFKCKNGHYFKRYINEIRLHGIKKWCKRCNNENALKSTSKNVNSKLS